MGNTRLSPEITNTNNSFTIPSRRNNHLTNNNFFYRWSCQNLNDVLPFNPTAENIARWCVEQIPTCYRAEVQESEGNLAAYEED